MVQAASLTLRVYSLLTWRTAVDIKGDSHTLLFADAITNGVLCMEVLEHCVDPFTVMEEISRVLKRNGILFLSTSFLYPEHDMPADYWRFTWNSIQKLLKNNFIMLQSIKLVLDQFTWVGLSWLREMKVAPILKTVDQLLCINCIKSWRESIHQLLNWERHNHNLLHQFSLEGI